MPKKQDYILKGVITSAIFKNILQERFQTMLHESISEENRQMISYYIAGNMLSTEHGTNHLLALLLASEIRPLAMEGQHVIVGTHQITPETSVANITIGIITEVDPFSEKPFRIKGLTVYSQKDTELYNTDTTRRIKDIQLITEVEYQILLKRLNDHIAKMKDIQKIKV